VKRIFAPIALAALLAACETYPQQDGYPPYPGDSYPPPYPGDPYPPTGPYPPGPPGAEPPMQACPIVSSRDWRAWVNAMPGPNERPTLHLSGTVVAPTAGYRMEFRPHLDERGGYPVEVVATLQPFPPSGPAAQVLTTHDLRWQWPLESGPVGSVTIECGDRQIAQVPVATAQ
jgi:hypothetical protein